MFYDDDSVGTHIKNVSIEDLKKKYRQFSPEAKLEAELLAKEIKQNSYYISKIKRVMANKPKIRGFKTFK